LFEKGFGVFERQPKRKQWALSESDKLTLRGELELENVLTGARAHFPNLVNCLSCRPGRSFHSLIEHLNRVFTFWKIMSSSHTRQH